VILGIRIPVAIIYGRNSRYLSYDYIGVGLAVILKPQVVITLSCWALQNTEITGKPSVVGGMIAYGQWSCYSLNSGDPKSKMRKNESKG